jgi:ketosteroid isomerase-like protein
VTISDVDISLVNQKLDFLLDRLAISDCIARHARGHDRHDADMISAAYHDDGFDEHGKSVNAGPDYAEWINAVHAAGSQVHLHNVTTQNVEVEGDVAHAESYVLVSLLNHDAQTARVINGRYIDRLERRDGVWRIVVRRSTVELMFTADASLLSSHIFRDQGYSRGVRSHRDLSYRRPLSIDSPAPEFW